MNRLAAFIDKYQDIMEAIQARRHWKQGLFNQVLFKDKMAIATEKVKQQDSNRTAPSQPAIETPPPKNKNRGMDR